MLIAAAPARRFGFGFRSGTWRTLLPATVRPGAENPTRDCAAGSDGRADRREGTTFDEVRVYAVTLIIAFDCR